MTISNYYLDESGNSGDLIKRNMDMSFGDQPMFSLAAVGIGFEDDLVLFLRELVKKYKYQSVDIKCKNIYKKKPKFILDVCNYIVDKELPFFIELVDKQYHICATIVNHYVIPAGCVGTESDGEVQKFRNMIADYIRSKSPVSCYQKLSDLCQIQTEESLIVLFNELIEFFKEDTGSDFSKCHLFVEETLGDYEEMKTEIGSGALSKFIPIPDTGKKEQDIFLLSHLSSIANILARINFYLKGDISGVTLIHDEQVDYDEIFKSLNEALPRMEFSNVIPPTPQSDYDLDLAPTLTFEKSERSVGIQVADLLAGYMSRYINDFMYEKKQLDDVYHDIYRSLSRAFNHGNSVGLNMVVPSQVREELDRFHFLREMQIRHRNNK